MTRLVATFFYSGLLSPASGTWGSLAALAAGIGLHLLEGPLLLSIATLALFPIGLAATRAYLAATGKDDPSEVVVDEAVGQWIALLPVSAGAAFVGASIWTLWPGLVAALVLFRLFDIWKPGPIGWADRRHDAMGVMLDDVFAGLFAAICLVALAALAHGIILL